ncbi:hypothetical protein V6N13_128337 [Hibiscus sabdariffa]|uniref:Uncharacterized protein n=1 Tax=Hibiscus sabdariffa TaxID=183260 RepID=A0ABR2P1L3_9ROSI
MSCEDILESGLKETSEALLVEAAGRWWIESEKLNVSAAVGITGEKRNVGAAVGITGEKRNVGAAVGIMEEKRNVALPWESRRKEKLRVYGILCGFFNGLDFAIRLLKLKGSMPTFTNVCPKVECLTDRRF